MMQRLIWILLFVLITFPVSGKEVNDWHRLNRGEITLYCQKQDLHHGEQIFEMMGEQIPEIMKRLQMESLEEIRIVLSPDEKTFHELTGGAIPEWGVGAADKTQRIVYLISPERDPSRQKFQQVIAHELTHLFVDMLVRGRELPRWFDEGLAMWISRDKRFWDHVRFSRAIITDQAVPLNQVDVVLDFRRDKAALAYWESQSAVQYIEDVFGYEAIPALLRAVNYSETWEDAFVTVMQMSPADFEMAWMTAMEKRYKWAFILDQRLLFSLLFVGLFMAAFFYKKVQNQKQIRLWDREDKETLEEI